MLVTDLTPDIWHLIYTKISQTLPTRTLLSVFHFIDVNIVVQTLNFLNSCVAHGPDAYLKNISW
jgi:hypothetical protein